MYDTVFTVDAGRFLSSRETYALKEAHRNAELACGQKENEFTRSEFLGLTKIKQLLDQPGCVGLRVHYGERWEDEAGELTEPGKGQLKPRVLLTGVDARGKDLPAPGHAGGLKDDGGDGGDLVVGDGYTCPRHCP